MAAESTKDFGGFNLWLPFEFEKGGEVDRDPKDKRIWIKGIATTANEDLQGESVNLNGLDWDYAVKTKAWFDTDHNPNPEAGRGRLTKVVPNKRYKDPVDGKTKTGAYVEGYLYPTEENQALADLLAKMDEVGDEDGIGLSIRGPIQARTGPGNRTIAKGVVRSIAITRQPVNTDTRLSLMEFSKSLATVQKSLEAGEVLPSSGGGSGAALLRQDLSTRRSNKAMKKKDRKAFFNSLSAEQQKALKDNGFKDDEGEDEDEREDGMEKALSDANEFVKSINGLSEHLDEGGKIAFLDSDGSAVAKVEGLAEMSKAVAAFGKLQTHIAGQLDELCKALNKPHLPRAVKAGEAVEHTNLLSTGDFVSLADAQSQVMAEFQKAIGSGDQNRAQKLAASNAHLGAASVRGRVSKDELKKALGQ